jgi:hypothetical protein
LGRAISVLNRSRLEAAVQTGACGSSTDRFSFPVDRMVVVEPTPAADVGWALACPGPMAGSLDDKKVTVKPLSELFRGDVSSWRLPLLSTMSIAMNCHFESLIGPVVPLIVAEQFVNVIMPKFARGAMPVEMTGASMIHSAL